MPQKKNIARIYIINYINFKTSVLPFDGNTVINRTAFFKMTYDKIVNITSLIEWYLMNIIYIKSLIYNHFNFHTYIVQS